MIKQAVIVAAGLSSRLYPLTSDKPKCLLPLNDESIIERNVKLLKKQGIETIYIVTGYLATNIEIVLGNEATFIFNPFYKYCNNMGSLFLAKEMIRNKPFFYMHGDVVFTESLLRDFLDAAIDEKNQIHLAVDFGQTDEEAMKVKLTQDHLLIESNKAISLNESSGEWTGLAVVYDSTMLFSSIEKILKDELLNVYDTFAFTDMVQAGAQIKCHSIHDEKWIEIDFIEDYEKAKRMFRCND